MARLKQIKRKTVKLTNRQDAFIKRKKDELQRLVGPGKETLITESGVIQGLIDFWMAIDAGETGKNRPKRGA